MHSIKSLIIILVLLPALWFSPLAFSQSGIQREVRVVKPYMPTLSEANKINFLPDFNDTIRVNPNFRYAIQPKRFETDFKIDPIKPAKMVGLPIQKLYKSQLSLGAGNYMTPYMELTINQLRAKTTQFGFYYKHLSSTGKIKLDNNKRVDSDYNDNLMKLYAKKIFKESVLEADASGGYNSVLYYGYNTKIDTLLDRSKNIQKILSANSGLKYYSMHPDSSHVNYYAGINYAFVHDFFNNTEHNVDFNTAINKKIGNMTLGGDLIIRYFNNLSSLDSSDFSVVDVNPWFSKSSKDWKFQAGLDVNYDQSNATVNYYPRVNFEFNIVPQVLIPYMGIDGYKDVNNYGEILFENSFLKPGTDISNTNHKLIVFAGLKGRYSNRISFNMKASYESIDSMYFFINDSSNILNNQFVPVYDNGSLLDLGAELRWHTSEKLQLLAKAVYQQYQLDMLEYAWHRPTVAVSLAANYDLREKIIIDADIFYTGIRYAPVLGGNINELKGYIDANLAVEYRYTKLLSFFIKFNNLTASRYEIWNQYPVQRFQFLAGFTYAL